MIKAYVAFIKEKAKVLKNKKSPKQLPLPKDMEEGIVLLDHGENGISVIEGSHRIVTAKMLSTVSLKKAIVITPPRSEFGFIIFFLLSLIFFLDKEDAGPTSFERFILTMWPNHVKMQTQSTPNVVAEMHSLLTKYQTALAAKKPAPSWTVIAAKTSP